MRPRALEPVGTGATGLDRASRPQVATQVVTLAEPARIAERHCGEGSWPTYAHDAARTSASDGCCEGPLEEQWSFAPEPFAGRAGRVHHAIVDGDAIYAAGLRGDSPVLHRVDAQGKVSWTFDSRADIHREDWPTSALGSVLVNDDGLYMVDPLTGKHQGRGLDTWGESLASGTRFFAVNRMKVDGPGLFVAAYDAAGKIVWKKDKFDGPSMFQDEISGICLEGGVVFHTANNRFPSHSYVSALDPLTGERVWSVATLPESAPSAGQGSVFAIESVPDEKTDKLVARSQRDGGVAWSREVSGARGPAPVLAGKLVIVHGDEGVVAVDAVSGELAWKSSIPRTRSTIGHATSLAAALGSKTLVVTAGGVVHLLRLADGSEQWRGPLGDAGSDVHSPVVVGRALYVVADGELVRFGMETSPDKR